ncbi:DedA family protein [Glycomyces arizonensis]|uniref:DedA family protein n=1 Tax=Glycomyces arizonensis TaxID=256035 RepID=UPI00042772E1|nr:DedA family protein [Glycomyces arizonensis]
MLSDTLALTMAAGETEPGGFIGWVLDLMDKLGEVGVGLALAIETIFPPVPSELILPVAGYLSYDGKMNFGLVMLCASIGSLLGGWFYYYVGLAFGRERTRWLFEKLPLFEVKDFELAERVFAKWGVVAVLAGRCLPIVRSVISIPAGIERMPFWKFTLFTLIGSTVWNSIWVGLGFGFGRQIEPVLNRYSGLLSNIVLGIIAVLVLWFVVSRTIKAIRNKGRGNDSGPGTGSGSGSGTDTVILRRVR